MKQNACHKLADLNTLTFDVAVILLMIGICTIILLVTLRRER